MRVPSDLKPYINSAKENLLWYGQPLKPDSSNTLKPVQSLLITLAGAFFLYAVYIMLVDLPAGDDNGLRNLFISITMGVIFVGAWLILPTTLDMKKNNTYYVVTDQRAMNIEHNPVEPGRSKILEWGAGDIGEPSVKSGAVIFVETEVDQGKTETGDKRAPIGWGGFIRLPESEVERAQNALKDLIQPKDPDKIATIENKLYKFSIKRPVGWSVRTFIVPPGYRDDFLFTTLSGDAIEQYSLLRGARVDAEWNTAILTKRHGANLQSEKGSLHYLTMIVEAAAVNHPPGEKPGKFDAGSSIDFNTAVKIGNSFAQRLREAMLICQLREGYQITDDTLAALENKVQPKGVIKQIGALKGREFGSSEGERDSFLHLLKKVIVRKQDFNANKKPILEYSQMHHPMKREGDSKNFTLMINKAAQPVELNIPGSHEMETGITMMGIEYKIKQIYSFKYFKRSGKCLHLRYTFFCTHKKDSTLFDDEKEKIMDIARSTGFLMPKFLDI